MNDGEKVSIRISPAGRVTIDAQGFQGCGCEEATQAVHVLLGGRGDTEYKPEYFEAPAANTAAQTRSVF